MVQYQYRPLDHGEIRLLYLDPGSSGDMLKCKLQHVSSTNIPKYETISYCWGDITRSSTVKADDRSLAVPNSTAQALLHFRDPDKVRSLWIDAVCINQNDGEERSIHVAKMHTIYASGETNLIWIGEDDGTVADAVRDMGLVMEEMRKDTDSFRTFPMPGDTDYYRHNRSGLKLDIDLTSLVRLCSRPWFGRLWVVQEAALSPANLCHCGDHTFDLATFLRVARWLWMKRNFLNLGEAESVFVQAGLMFKSADKELGYHQYGRRQGWFRKEGSQRCVYAPTYWLLVGLQGFVCREPVDHVYGMLGLHQQLSESEELPELLRPHPNKSVRDVFRDATRLAILEDHSLSSLCAVHRRREEIEDSVQLPSWVPAWHRPWVPDLDPHPFSRDYRASGNRQLNVAEVSQHALEAADEIKLEGVFIDGPQRAIAEVVSQSDVHFSSTLAYLEAVETLIRSHASVDIKADLEKTVDILLCAGKNAATESATDDDLLGYSELKGILETSTKILLHEPDSTNPRKHRASRYDAASRRAYHQRRFFITSSGRIGLGPPTMQQGDAVAILYGGEMPFVLRHFGDKYELVGPCYVHGVMEGQVVKEHEEWGDADVRFCIK